MTVGAGVRPSGLLGAGCLLAAVLLAAPAAAASGISAVLEVDELGFDARLRIRLFHDPAFLHVPESAGHLFLVAADSAAGKDAFFIPSDLAFEIGAARVYPVEFEQASDLFGQALGGRLRPGEVQVGFLMVPPAARLTEFLPAHPESVTVRYAHHRTAFAAADTAAAGIWRELAPLEILSAGLTAWWQWLAAVESAPEMNTGDRRFLAERVFPGQGHVLEEESMSAEGLRNAILRVGERRLLESRVTQRVAPVYPGAALQAGVGGLVVALCYVTAQGEVGDAQVLASNTVHLLNLAALSAAMEWRFATTRGPGGDPEDGWRMLPFQFRIAGAEAPSSLPDTVGYEPPRIVKLAEPELPFEVTRRRIKGTVAYRVLLDAQGRLVETELLEGLDPIVDRAVLEAIERSRFLPATRFNRPTRGELRVPFEIDTTQP